jgi:signal peptidase I
MAKVWKEWLLPLFVAAALSLLIRGFVAEARVIPSSSMEPTLHVSDRVLLDKLFYRFKIIDQGDIIVFWPPSGVSNDYPFIKRVIGLSGDSVLIVDGAVYVNGEPLREQYLEERWHGDFGPVTVPDGKLFVLGDNRSNSLDSRYWVGICRTDRRCRQSMVDHLAAGPCRDHGLTCTCVLPD